MLLKDKKLRDWPEKTKCQLKTGRLLIVLFQGSINVMEVLDLTRLQAPTIQAESVDEISNVVTREMESFRWFSTVRESCPQGAVRVFQGEVAGQRL